MDRRARPRTPGWTYGVVRWDTGAQVHAIIWDLSDGGVAVEVGGDEPASRRFLLGLVYHGKQVTFPLDVVGRGSIDGRPLVHARFDQLSDAQHDILGTLIADWRQAVDRRQLWLTTRANDVASRSGLILPGDVRPYHPKAS